MFFHQLWPKEFYFRIRPQHGKIDEWKECCGCMLYKREFAKTFHPFNVDGHGDKPTHYRNELPKEPMFATICSNQNHPCIIKRNPAIAGIHICFCKHFREAKTGQK